MHTLSADWIFPIAGPPLQDHTIEFDAGKIRSIRPAAPEDPRIDHAVLLPGLINTHTHLAYTVLRNQLDHLSFFPWIRKLTELKQTVLTPADLALSARLGILECLRAGMTTVADMSDSESALAELSRSPMRGIFYWEVFGVERDHADRSWSDLQSTFPRLQQQYGTARLKIGISPHATFTVRPELYGRVAKWALGNEIPVSFHAAESRAEESFISKRSGIIAQFLEKRAADWQMLGSTSISHLEGTGILETRPLLAHCVQASAADCRILARWKVPVAHCPKSNAKFGHGVAPLSRFRARGVTVGLGTDSAASNNRLDLFEEARFALLQQRSHDRKCSLTEAEVLEMITLQGARALRMEDRVGSLEPGKAADFIAVRVPAWYTSAGQVERHLVHNTTSADVLGTWIEGTPVSVSDLDAEIQDIYRRCS